MNQQPLSTSKVCALILSDGQRDIGIVGVTTPDQAEPWRTSDTAHRAYLTFELGEIADTPDSLQLHTLEELDSRADDSQNHDKSTPDHTAQDDFDHFLSYSGMFNEPQFIKNKLWKAFEAGWSPDQSQVVKSISEELNAVKGELKDRSDAATDALDLLWKEVIYARNGEEYEPWEYPGQAYRHLKAEFDELLRELEALRKQSPTKPSEVDTVLDKSQDI